MTGIGSSHYVIFTSNCHPREILVERLDFLGWTEREGRFGAGPGDVVLIAADRWKTALTVLGGAGVRIVSDELNHASIVDGCRLARAEVAVYRHNDLDHAEALVAAHPGRSVVVSDSVFSMDGDEADVPGLLELCRRHGAALVLDEAHAVFGPDVPDPGDVALLRVGTCSKVLASLGGFVAASRPMIDLLVNRGRPFVFTTASSPADTAAALAALRAGWDPRAIPICTGFIGQTPDGRTTTLGRNGSDYTAALLARALEASELIICTDVSGVMTADPRIVSDAYPVSHLSYLEALELANYGAKMFHARTMLPLIASSTPVLPRA